jgi:hypothetical protein
MAGELKGCMVGGEGKIAGPRRLDYPKNRAGDYHLRYAQRSTWREDDRRVSNSDQTFRVVEQEDIGRFCGILTASL